MTQDDDDTAAFWRRLNEVYDRNLAAEMRAKRVDDTNIGLVGGAPQ